MRKKESRLYIYVLFSGENNRLGAESHRHTDRVAIYRRY